MWGFGKLVVEGVDKAVADVGIGGWDVGDAISCQQHHQPVLQRAKEPLHLTFGLGGVGADPLDLQDFQHRPTWVGSCRPANSSSRLQKSSERWWMVWHSW